MQLGRLSTTSVAGCHMAWIAPTASRKGARVLGKGLTPKVSLLVVQDNIV